MLIEHDEGMCDFCSAFENLRFHSNQLSLIPVCMRLRKWHFVAYSQIFLDYILNYEKV